MFVYCDDTGYVDAVEFASPGHGVEADDQVVFDDVDLFIDSANAVVDRLREKGHRVVDEEGGYSTAPDVLLALWRDGEPFDDSNGLPAYFESALIARPGYYD